MQDALSSSADSGISAFVALGANLGDARRSVLQAMDALQTMPLTRVRAFSRLYASAPVDATGADYVNAVVQLVTNLSAPALLAHLQALERAAGRQRPFPNAPRTLDLDLLLYGDAHISSPTLVLPHPRMYQRAFVLRPLADIAPQRVTPEMLRAVADQAIALLSE